VVLTIPMTLRFGGVALLRCQKALEAVKVEGDLQIGVNIVRRALEEPMRQIASNAGWEGSIVVVKVKEMKQDMGFNALTEKYDDMIKTGILDPTKVVRIARRDPGHGRRPRSLGLPSRDSRARRR
jgi:chaperonin GroEL